MPAQPSFKPGPSKKPQRRGRINPVERAAGRDIVGPIDGRNTAIGVHQAIYTVIREFGPQPDPRDWLYVAGQLTAEILKADKEKTNYVLRLRQRLASYAAAYFVRYAPLGPWQCLGSEVSVGRYRFDLVWEDPLGRIWVDEIKTRRMAPRERLTLQTQAPAYAKAAHKRWPATFAGVRACPLLVANGGYIIDRNGERGDLVR